MRNRLLYNCLLVGCMLALFGCEESPLDEVSHFQTELVVDGRIETDALAQVFITRTIPYYFDLDSSQMLDFVIRQARVEISDGENSEVLTLRFNERYFPPYFYQGRLMRGEPGKTYELNIRLGEMELTSTTTIPDMPVVDSAWFEPSNFDPELGTVSVRMINEPEQQLFYRFYTMVYSDSEVFHPSLLPNFDGRFFPEREMILSLNKGPSSFMKMEDAEFLFSASDTIVVKVCRMDREQYLFWESYQEEVFGGSNPFTAGNRQVRSNINGGLGNWGGFSVVHYHIYPREE
ncbi:DUF4249 family protein [Natronoflexus pectinivorans]|uniref:Uncharacterized protein DUF4249 n=1 Tax=Natronoflexus pectinivorans TaxID=682526 RepID=A0A4R2GHF2_9BACT|nr:DUF4249 family protein [Natronoflexus pectinivorans]TCO07492.1 uncharacterized protein DUF4249 [Natronoflexus pectinivorans]